MSMPKTSNSLGGFLTLSSAVRPFHYQERWALSIFVPVKEPSRHPVRPALAARRREELAPRQPKAVARLEALLAKAMVVLLVLTAMGCGVGAQHIDYLRKQGALCRRLRQQEREIRTLAVACHSLEATLALKPVEDARRAALGPIVANRTLQKPPTRG